MSVIKKILVTFLALACVMAASACNKEENPQKEGAAEQLSSETENQNTQLSEKTKKAQNDALAKAALEKLTALPQYPDSFPTLDAVAAQYKAADTAVGWIVGTTKVATDAKDTLSANGLQYERVKPDCATDEKLIYNIETLEAYLATLIRPEEAVEFIIDIEESFEIPKFIENENGELYALPYSYPVEGYGEDESYDLSKNDDGSYTFTVNYSVIHWETNEEIPKSRSFRYVNVDGRWVFEDFYIIKQ